MDFMLDSLAGAFKSADYQTKHQSFALFAFLLATPADRGIFPDLLMHFSELNRLTGNHILVIAPRIAMYKAPNVSMTVEEITQVLSTKKFRNHYSGQVVDVSEQVQDFLGHQTQQTYDFAEYIGISMAEIPSIAFFETLKSPEHYALWSIRDMGSQEVIHDFRRIVSKIVDANRDSSRATGALPLIASLDRRRFAIRVLRSLGSALPVAGNLLSAI